MLPQRHVVLFLAFVLLVILGSGVAFGAALTTRQTPAMAVGLALVVVAGPGAFLTFKLGRERTWASRTGRQAGGEEWSVPPDAVDLSVRLRDVIRGARFSDRGEVRLDGRGVTVSKGGADTRIPLSAVRAAGLVGPVNDPTIAVWYDPGGVPGNGAGPLAGGPGPDGTAVALLAREAALPEGRRDQVRRLAGTRWSVPWRVADEQGAPVPEPDPRALLTADRFVVDETGYRLERDRSWRAVICEKIGQKEMAGVHTPPGRNPVRTVRLRDPWAEPVLTVHKPRAMLYNRQQVALADGTPVGEIKEAGAVRNAFELLDTAGRALARAESSPDDPEPEVRYFVADGHGRRFAVLTMANENPSGDIRVEIEASAPERLRVLTAALPIAMRIAGS
ncbi:MAG TPA: hypothetical protein VIL71_03235 [Spirillospora sp.]